VRFLNEELSEEQEASDAGDSALQGGDVTHANGAHDELEEGDGIGESGKHGVAPCERDPSVATPAAPQHALPHGAFTSPAGVRNLSRRDKTI